jgi:hypothetical protein
MSGILVQEKGWKRFLKKSDNSDNHSYEVVYNNFVRVFGGCTRQKPYIHPTFSLQDWRKAEYVHETSGFPCEIVPYSGIIIFMHSLHVEVPGRRPSAK